MTNILLNKKIAALKHIKTAGTASSHMVDDEKASPKQSQWRFRRKAKYALAIAVAAILLISFSAAVYRYSSNSECSRWLGVDFSPSSHQSSAGLVVSGQPVNSSVWLGVASNAWSYFQPGVGVDSNTGLPYASGTNFEAFTAWDLGVYIQAILDAQKLGLVSSEGTWGSSARLEKVMSFLENRPLNATTGFPFWYYEASTGQDYHPLSDKAKGVVDGADTGRLFLALSNLRTYNSSLAPMIDNIVYNQSDYAALLPSVEDDATSGNVYSYYIDSGYGSFWPQQVGNIPSEVINNIVGLQKVTTFGVSLPDAAITTEPLLCAIFELNSSNTELNGLMQQVYLAHEAYFNDTGKYVAFSEGNSFTSQYLYEWVVAPGGQPWKITSTSSNLYLNMNPIIYTKVTFSFLALYNSTFAQNLVVYLQNMLPNPTSKGYCDGANSNGQTIPGTGCNTNGLILDAALYATRSVS
jgi:hypothetical protein